MSCHLEILSLGMPCSKDMPRMGVVRKLLKHFDQNGRGEEALKTF
jgi:hypothetical protein